VHVIIILFLVFSHRMLGIIGWCLLVYCSALHVYHLLALHYSLVGLMIGRSLDVRVMCLFFKELIF